MDALMVATSVGPGASAPVRSDYKSEDKHLEYVVHEESGKVPSYKLHLKRLSILHHPGPDLAI